MTMWTKELSIWVLVIDTVTLVTGLPANLLALYTFVRKIKQRATPLDVLLLSLNISDLIFLVVLPFHLKEAADMKWTMPFFFCPLSGFIFYSTFHNSILLLTAIGVDRYLGVAFPIKYKLKRHPRNAAIASVLFWLISTGNCSIIYIVQYYKHNDTNLDPSSRNTCYKEFSEEQLKLLLPVRLELSIVLFLIPFLISCFCYINFIRILSRLPNINYKKRYRAIGLALATFVVFVICFMPLNVSQVVGYIGWYSPSWRLYMLLPSTLNACLDPFVFYFSSSALRETFRRIMRQLANRLHLTSAQKYFNCKQVNCAAAEDKQNSMDTSRDNQLRTSTDF